VAKVVATKLQVVGNQASVFLKKGVDFLAAVL
jgi:hypothetical protein